MKEIMKRFTAAFGIFFLGGITMAFGAEGGSMMSSTVLQWLALGNGIGLGLAALGCGMGQGRMVQGAMEGISRNPKAGKDMFVPMILGLAFIEALTIYALIFAFIFNAAFG